MNIFLVNGVMLLLVGAMLVHAGGDGEGRERKLHRSCSAMSLRDYKALYPSFVRAAEQRGGLVEVVAALSPEPSSSDSDDSERGREEETQLLRCSDNAVESPHAGLDAHSRFLAFLASREPFFNNDGFPLVKAVSLRVASILVRYERHVVCTRESHPETPPFARLILSAKVYADALGIFVNLRAYADFLKEGQKLLVQGAKPEDQVHISYEGDSVTVTCEKLLQTLREFYCQPSDKLRVQDARKCPFLEGLEGVVMWHKTNEALAFLRIPAVLTVIISDYCGLIST